MKTLIVLAALVAGVLLTPKQQVECAWCPSYRCYGPCGGNCQCVTWGGESGGHCVSVERITSEMTVLK